MSVQPFTLEDVWARVTRAYEALEDGDVALAAAILSDLEDELRGAISEGRAA